MDDSSWKVSLAIFGLIILVVATAFIADKLISEDKYNGGHCECGGHYEFIQGVGHRYSSTYIYRCDNCGNTIEISYLPKD